MVLVGANRHNTIKGVDAHIPDFDREHIRIAAYTDITYYHNQENLNNWGATRNQLGPVNEKFPKTQLNPTRKTQFYLQIKTPTNFTLKTFHRRKRLHPNLPFPPANPKPGPKGPTRTPAAVASTNAKIAANRPPVPMTGTSQGIHRRYQTTTRNTPPTAENHNPQSTKATYSIPKTTKNPRSPTTTQATGHPSKDPYRALDTVPPKHYRPSQQQ